MGNIYKIFNSGIIDYEIDENAPGWKHVRDDGAIIEEIVYWQWINSDWPIMGTTKKQSNC